jgi:hypothetical protein
LFYIKSNDKAIKTIQEGLILNHYHLTDRGLAYWNMGVGSLQKDRKTMILHTFCLKLKSKGQSYTKTEKFNLSRELNEKFGFRSEVILHKKTKKKIFCSKI